VDVRLAQAREHHRLAGESDRSARQHREQRDWLVRSLRADDHPLTYEKLAAGIGCSPELIAYIVTGRRSAGRHEE